MSTSMQHKALPQLKVTRQQLEKIIKVAPRLILPLHFTKMNNNSSLKKLNRILPPLIEKKFKPSIYLGISN